MAGHSPLNSIHRLSKLTSAAKVSLAETLSARLLRISSHCRLCRQLRRASDRFNINSQLEHLQARYVGTGHADLTRFEWAVNIQRDSFASYVGHYPMLAYFAIAENESIGRERYNFMQVCS
nr:Splicing factor 3B subunit 5/RDS3 complex subunit 10 [Ipomoea batatas]